MNRIVPLVTTISLLILGGVKAYAENITAGTGAGSALSSGDKNILIGNNAGAAVSTGSDNIIIGDNAGKAIAGGSRNVIVGADSAPSVEADDLVALGYRAGLDAVSAARSVFVGNSAGSTNTTGVSNVFFGRFSGRYNETGSGNVGVGHNALLFSADGKYNTALGYDAGADIGQPTPNANPIYSGIEHGSRNTVAGNSAGEDIGAGIGNSCFGTSTCQHTEHADLNTFVGFGAGWDNNRTNESALANRNVGLGALAGLTNRRGSDNVWVGTLTDSADWTLNNLLFMQNQLAGASTGLILSNGHTRNNQNTNISRVTAVGSKTSVLADNGTSLGYSNRLSGANTLLLGQGIQSTHANAVAIGHATTTFADHTITLGNAATSLLVPAASDSVSLGDVSRRFNTVFSQGLSIQSAANSDALLALSADNAATDSNRWQMKAINSTAFQLGHFASGGFAPSLSVSNAGDLTLAGNLHLNSDQRLKYAIEPVLEARDILLALTPRRYYWRPELAKSEGEQLGFIAQEVLAVAPELVSENAEGLLSVKYSAITPLLVSALNQQDQYVRQQIQELHKVMQQLGMEAL